MPYEQYLLSSIEFIFILEIRSISTLYIYKIQCTSYPVSEFEFKIGMTGRPDIV